MGSHRVGHDWSNLAAAAVLTWLVGGMDALSLHAWGGPLFTNSFQSWKSSSLHVKHVTSVHLSPPLSPSSNDGCWCEGRGWDLGIGLRSAWHTSTRQQKEDHTLRRRRNLERGHLGELGMFTLGVLVTVFKHLMTCLLNEELAPEDRSMCGRCKLHRLGIKQQQMGSISDGHLFSQSHLKILGLPRWHSGRESACQCRRLRTCWIRFLDQEDPWSRKWQPIPIFLPGEFLGQKSLVGYSPWGISKSSTQSSNWAYIP